MNSLVKIAVSLTILAASTGQLAKMIYKIQLAQLYLIKESQASKWGMPMLPPEQSQPKRVKRKSH